MLEKIIIKNYLLLKDIEINFGTGFNIITGETGAGKSILINAMSLLLGERADYSIISKNKEKMVVETWIKRTKNNKEIIKKYLLDLNKERRQEPEDNSISEQDYVIIRRELYSKGYSRNFINDSPANINDLKIIGDLIVDIHSQNEHQSLLNKNTHINLLDSYIQKKNIAKKFDGLLDEYTKDYEKLCSMDKELIHLTEKKKDLENKRSFIEFQLKEINDVGPKPGEDEELEKELKLSENTEFIQKSINSARADLYDDSGSVTERLKNIEKELAKIKDINDEIAQILKDISDSIITINEASRQLVDISNNLVFDPAKIESIRERLFKLQFIKKKYGSNLKSILKLKEELEKDLSVLENFDEKLASAKKEIEELKTKIYKASSEISSIRQEKAKILEKEIINVLNEVGFENAEFKINISPLSVIINNIRESSNSQITNQTEEDQFGNFTIKTKEGKIKITENGIDDVEFLVKINKGDDFSSLRKTASGGEISRIMLAIKTVLADADKIDVLIFDEIDTGISGRIAQKVGMVLKKLSGYHQVISVTHLAQVAALAEEHFLVEKEIEDNRTITKIKKLEKNERIIEVAKLLSGENVTDATIKSAKELIRS